MTDEIYSYDDHPFDVSLAHFSVARDERYVIDHYDTDWCKWGLMMIKALKAGYRSFTGWNLMLDETVMDARCRWKLTVSFGIWNCTRTAYLP